MTKVKFRGYNRVKFQSLKLGRSVFCQSLLLRDYLLHLEWDESIQSYDLKPFRIEYKVEGLRRTFRPHLLISNSDSSQTLVWLKYLVTDEENHNKLIRLISNICEAKGFGFQVKFPEDIRKEPFFSNIKFIRRYARCEITFNQILACKEFFGNHLNVNPLLEDLIQFFLQRSESAQTVYALLGQKIIEADFHSYSLFEAELPINLRRQFPNFEKGRIQA